MSRHVLFLLKILTKNEIKLKKEEIQSSDNNLELLLKWVLLVEIKMFTSIFKLPVMFRKVGFGV